MTSVGYILEVKGDMAKVRFIRESACGGNCSSCGGCNAKPIEKWIKNTLNVNCKDKVIIKTNSEKILFSAFVLYILPLVMFFSFYIILNIFFSEIISLLSGILAFFLSFFIAGKYGNRLNIEYEMERLA